MNSQDIVTFGDALPSGTIRTVVLTTTGVERPLVMRVLIDVSLPADQVMHVLWAASGTTSSSSALLVRHTQGVEPEYFGISTSWEHSANRDRVHGLENIQFAQLFLPDTELYAQLYPGRGYQARVKLAPAETLGDGAAGMPGSSIRVAHDPFGIPTALTAYETDVLLQASDGERLTPVEQQVLVDLTVPVDLVPTEICQVMALAVYHGVRSGLPAESVHLLPRVLVEIPYVLPTRELFRFIAESHHGMKLTKANKIPVTELRRLLRDSEPFTSVFEPPEALDTEQVQLSDMPLVQTAWEVLQATGLISIANQRAALASDADWLIEATEEDFETFVEIVLLRYLLETGEVPTTGWPTPDMHPTLHYETAQDYADTLISAELAAPDDPVEQLVGEQLAHLFDPDGDREHIEFEIELLGVSEPVTRRMSVPLDANLHASIETVLIMFGWQLTHLWELSLMAPNGMREPIAISFRDLDLDTPLAADHEVADVLTPGGPQLLLTYDFGDGWDMLITPVAQRTAGFSGELLAAHGTCPPEDSGGPGGYEQKLLAMRDPEEFRRQFPDFESAEIQEIAAWATAHGMGQRRVPEPDVYALDEHAQPYDI